MESVEKLLFLLLAVGCFQAIGCTTHDPFRVGSQTPVGPSSQFQPPAEMPPVVRRPSVPSWVAETPLSLAQCIYIALANNPRARVSWQETRSAAAAVGQAQSLQWPQIEFRGTAERRQAQVITEVEDEFLRSMRSATFSVTQLLLDGGIRQARVEVARASLRSADFRHNAMLLDTALDTETAYYRLLAAQSFLDVAEKTLQRRTHHFNLARKRYEAGVGRKVEASQSEAEKADAVLTLVEARNEVRLRRGQLAATMGLPVGAPLQIRDIPDEIRQLRLAGVESLLAEASTQRPRLKSAVAEISSMRQQLRAEEAARWPELNASLEYGWRATKLLPRERDEWVVGLGVTVPIFTGFQRTYRVRQAKAELQKALASYEGLLQDVELEVWRAYSDVLRANEAISAAETFVKSAGESVKAAEEECKAGRATVVELVDAQTTLTRALNRDVTAKLEWHLAIARLERALGHNWDQGLQVREPEQGHDSSSAGVASRPDNSPEEEETLQQ